MHICRLEVGQGGGSAEAQAARRRPARSGVTPPLRRTAVRRQYPPPASVGLGIANREELRIVRWWAGNDKATGYSQAQSHRDKHAATNIPTRQPTQAHPAPEAHRLNDARRALGIGSSKCGREGERERASQATFDLLLLPPHRPNERGRRDEEVTRTPHATIRLSHTDWVPPATSPTQRARAARRRGNENATRYHQAQSHGLGPSCHLADPTSEGGATKW